MRNPPLSEIQSWPPPNTINPETKGPALAAITITGTMLCFLAVGLRLHCRRFLLNSVGLDDYLICFTLVLTLLRTPLLLPAFPV